MKRHRIEIIATFSGRFSRIYYNFLKEIQPTKVVSLLHYETTFSPNISLLLLERKFVTLQQMFTDAQRVKEFFSSCGKVLDQVEDKNLDVEEYDSEPKKQTTNMKFDPKGENIMHAIEVSNDDVFVEKCISPFQEEVVFPNGFDADLNLGLCHHDQRNDLAMESFKFFSKEIHEGKSKNQFVKEKVDGIVFTIDDIEYVVDFPKYDEYDDDYIAYFKLTYSKQATAFHQSENDYFQQSKENSQPANFNCDNN
jgi:hypothetical protein